MRLWPLGCIAALAVRAYRRKSLTPTGVAVAIFVSSLYTLHPWGVFLVVLLAFYVTGTSLTKVPSLLLLLICKYKHNIKERLVMTSLDGKKPVNATVTRTHVQVLANSLAGSILMVLHFYSTRGRHCFSAIPTPHKSSILFLSDSLVYGIIGYFPSISRLILGDIMQQQQLIHGLLNWESCRNVLHS